MPLALAASTRSTLAEARQVHVAVPSTNGPHVTPELYAWSGDRLWFASATDTLKAAVLRRDPRVGAVVGVPGRRVLLAGEVEVFDPLDPVGLARRPGRLPAAVAGLAQFTVRNAADLLAFGADVVTGRLGCRLPPVRLLFALTPRCALTIEDEAVIDAVGGWSSLGTEPAGASVADVELAHGGVAAVLAVPGPIAVPGRWFADERGLHVPRALLPLVPSGRFDLGLVVDEYAAPGPAAKRGTLLRGTGRLAADGAAVIEVDTERRVEWDGVETESDAG